MKVRKYRYSVILNMANITNPVIVVCVDWLHTQKLTSEKKQSKAQLWHIKQATKHRLYGWIWISSKSKPCKTHKYSSTTFKWSCRQTNRHTVKQTQAKMQPFTGPVSFLQAGCPACRPTNSVKALKAVDVRKFTMIQCYKKTSTGHLNSRLKISLNWSLNKTKSLVQNYCSG